MGPTPMQLRVLLRAATAKDAQMAADVLSRAGIATHHCRSTAALVTELEHGAGALMLSEEALTEPGATALVRLLTMQPAWSDIPVLVLARSGVDSSAVVDAMDLPANVTVLERPMRVASLISALRSALRARQRQYELRAMLDGLRESDQRKTEFLATLAHELRNPLAPLTTTLSILERKAPGPAEARPYYELMGRQVEHMVRLVNDLMEVSRVTRAQIDLRVEVVAINDAIRAAIELSKPLIDAAGHRLEIEYPEPSPMVRGDHVRLTQVFSNLLNNAAKYTPTGGRIHVGIASEGRKAVVRVTDNGVGIPADMLESVFGMFVQVAGTSRVAQGGLGIGLTLVKSLVELHGGTVAARNAGAGSGAVVTVTLPLVKAGEQDAAIDASARPVGALSGHILIVDDNRDAADSMAAVLELLGASTTVAYDGEEALQKAEAMRPSVAILDIGMPRMDGCELARQLRAKPMHAGIALVALTGWGQSTDKERIANAGFDRHLLKPVDLADLAKVLQQLCARED